MNLAKPLDSSTPSIILAYIESLNAVVSNFFHKVKKTRLADLIAILKIVHFIV